MQYDFSSTRESGLSPKLRRSSPASLPTAAIPPGTFCIPGGQLNSFAAAAVVYAAFTAATVRPRSLLTITSSARPADGASRRVRTDDLAGERLRFRRRLFGLLLLSWLRLWRRLLG